MTKLVFQEDLIYVDAVSSSGETVESSKKLDTEKEKTTFAGRADFVAVEEQVHSRKTVLID